MRSGFKPVMTCAILLLSACGQSEPSGGAAGTTSAHQTAAATTPLPAGTHEVNGRIATIRLPYRTADNLLWVSATGVMEAAPFMFQDLEIEPHAGPDGTDLAVFTYKADKPGTATLEFGLVPPGKTLLGKGPTRFEGEPASRYAATVTAR